VELAEFRMFDMGGSLISWDDISEKAGGCRGDNAASKAFDGSIDGNMYASGRWNPQDVCLTSDRGCVALLMEMESGVAIGSYEWVSGGVRNADPVSWTLEARNDEDEPWVQLNEQINYDETVTSKMTIGPFDIAAGSDSRRRLAADQGHRIFTQEMFCYLVILFLIGGALSGWFTYSSRKSKQGRESLLCDRFFEEI